MYFPVHSLFYSPEGLVFDSFLTLHQTAMNSLSKRLMPKKRSMDKGGIGGGKCSRREILFLALTECWVRGCVVGFCGNEDRSTTIAKWTDFIDA
jgi:hypothetical protein